MRTDPDRRDVLVITDNTGGRWVPRLRAARAHGRVLPLGLDPGVLVHAAPAGPWTLVDLSGDALKAQADVRAAVPALLYALPRQALNGAETLFDLFQDRAVNRWWFLEISEKSPLRGRLVNQLYALALIRAAVAHGGFGEIWLEIEDRRLAEVVRAGLGDGLPVRQGRRRFAWRARVLAGPFVRYPIVAAGTWGLHVVRCLVLRTIGLGRMPPIDGAVAFFSFYPAWWNHPYDPEATERFFGSLPERLRDRAPVCFALWLTAGPLTLWRRRAALRRLAARFPVVLLQPEVGVRGAGEVLSLQHLSRLLRFRFRLAHAIRTTFAGFPVGPLISDEIVRSMIGGEFFMDLLISRAVDRLAGRMWLRAVIYRVEFQPFEKAILAGLRGRAAGVGFQHSTFGQNYLPYFFVPGELDPHNSTDPRAMPLPDLLVATGGYARDVMARNGFSPHRLEICGPVRYAGLLAHRRRGLSSPEIRRALGLDPRARIFLVTTSVVRAESLALLVALRGALERLSTLPSIIFKGHPAMPLDDEFHRLVASMLRGAAYRILPSDAPLHEYIGAADGVVLTGTTVGLEAMLLGVVPIVFESRGIFDAKAMSEVEEACFVVRDALELSRAMQWVLDDDARVRDVRLHWDRAVTRMFDGIDQDPHDRFVQILAKHGLIA